jgi:T4 superinfection immunity protein
MELLSVSTSCLGIAIYFLPAIVANHRNATHEISIFWINFLLGWTVLGWFAVLILDCGRDRPSSHSRKLVKVFPRSLDNSCHRAS